jgi:uncharacterized protein involved in outer membrane biogenesis
VIRLPQGRWPRRLAIVAVGLLVVWALAWAAVPPLVRWQAEKQLSAQLGRAVTIAGVAFRPWSLELDVTGLAIAAAPGAPAGAPPLAAFDRLHVDASIASLLRLVPVVEAAELDGLRVHLSRTDAGRWDIDDLLARFAPTPQAEPPGEPARFSLHNLQLRGATLVFDDRPVGRTHRVEALTLSLPFLSNRPSDIAVRVEPRLAFRANGAAFDTGAQATPFARDHAATVKIDVRDLDLAPYLGYLPASLPVRLRQGRIGAAVTLQFAQPGAVPELRIAGQLRADQVAVDERGGAPLVAWRALQLDLADVQPLARRLAFGTLRIEGAVADLARDATGRLPWDRMRAATPPRAAAPPADAAPPAAAWQLRLARLELADAQLRWQDASVQPAAALALAGLGVQVDGIAWPMEAPAPFSASAELRAGPRAAGTLKLAGRASDRSAQVQATLDALPLDAVAPYLAQVVVPRVEGQLAATASVDWSAAADAPRLAVAVEAARLDGLKLSEGRAAPALAWRSLAVGGVAVDLPARRVSVAQLRLDAPNLRIERGAQGPWNLERWRVAGPPASASASASAPAPAPAPAGRAGPAAEAAPPWSVRLQSLAVDGGALQLADGRVAPEGGSAPLTAAASGLKLGLRNLAWPTPPGAAPAKLDLALRVAAGGAAARDAGLLEWRGELLPEPLLLRGRLRAERLPLHLAAPYAMQAIADAPAVALVRAEGGYTGSLLVRGTPAGLEVQAAGDALVGGVALHARPDAAAGLTASDELLSWQALTVKALKVDVKPGDKPRIDLGEVVLADFFSRLVITEQGRFNLRDVAARPAAGAASAPALAPAAAAASAPAGPRELPVVVAVGGVQLRNGRIDFSDRFVRPNYSADLTGLNGSLGAFRSDRPETAALALRGRAAGTADLEIRGALNPATAPLALDIRAKATDLELAPLSPYAGRYAGYGIERGKLTMEVAYRIGADGRLDASNRVLLNQLTFGEKIESTEATKLPVLLAVALLKDRNGVIDIDLPISGSINDPQFSVFGIVLKVIGNLLVKAITAPFSLLFGGSGPDLSVVAFEPGTARIAGDGAAALDKVAKALADRPALKMTVTGAADPQSERDAFQRATLEARIAAERRRAALRAGAAADATLPPAVPEERERIVRELYRTTDIPAKPRNALGFVRDIPPAEMEALLRGRTLVTADAMRELALQRGLAVRDALVAKGLPAERLFLAAPKLRASGEDDAVWSPRVQLELSQR